MQQEMVKIDENGFSQSWGGQRPYKMSRRDGLPNAVEELQHMSFLMPSMQPSARSDLKKGEKIILITDQESVEKSSIVKLGREPDYGDFYIPSEIKSVPEIPVLGSGKTNYVALEKTL